MMALEQLTWQHGIKVCPDQAFSVEDCMLAVGEELGHASEKNRLHA